MTSDASSSESSDPAERSLEDFMRFGFGPRTSTSPEPENPNEAKSKPKTVQIKRTKLGAKAILHDGSESSVDYNEFRAVRHCSSCNNNTAHTGSSKGQLKTTLHRLHDSKQCCVS